MPAVVAAAIIAGGSFAAAKVASNANRDAANQSTSSANYAADVKSKSDQAALDFEKQQAAQNQSNFEATQKANYDQWAAREGRLSTLGQMLGMPGRNIPAYVPTTNLTGQPSGAGSAGGSTTSRTAPAISADKGDIGAQIDAYFKSQGVNNSETPYWVQKWSEFGAKDPAYFNQRLAAADVFGGNVATKPGPAAPVSGSTASLMPTTLGAMTTPYSPMAPALAAPAIRYQPTTMRSLM